VGVGEQLKTVRNVAILLAIAAAVFFIPGGGRAAHTFEAVLLTAFGLGAGYFGLYMYREQRISLHGLGDHHRGLLYGAVALAVFEWVGHDRMWQTSFGELAWFVLAGIVVYSLLTVYRRWRSYNAY
jgi:hypothetical protein